MAKSTLSLDDLSKSAIKQAKKDFLFYIKHFGLERARERINEETLFTEVKEYANNYNPNVKSIELDNEWMQLYVMVDHLRFKVVAIVDTVEEADKFGDDVGIICSDNQGHHIIAELQPTKATKLTN